MKTWHLLVVVALFSAAAMFSAGCDNDDTADDAASGTGATDAGEVSDGAASGDAAADAGDETDSGPMPEEQFNQLKELLSNQVLVVDEQVKTLTKINEEHKDETLAKMLDEIRPKTEALREKLEKATRHDRTLIEKDYGVAMTDIGERVDKAMARMQEVVRAKAGLPPE